MKFTVQKEALRGLLAAVSPAIQGRPTLPVLGMVLLEAQDDSLRATGTDLDLAVQTGTLAQDVEPGAVCAPLATLRPLVDRLPAGPVEVETKGDNLKIRAGRGRFEVHGLPATEFPEVKWPSFAALWRHSSPQLFAAIDAVAFAVSTEETRPILNGVLCQLHEGEMRWVATNGHRLALAAVPAPEGAEAIFGSEAIVHPRALTVAKALLAGAGLVDIARDENHLAFRSGDTRISTRLIEGPYPNYEQVIPRDLDKSLIAEVGALRQATERVHVLASDQTHRISVELARDAGVKLAAQTPDQGSADEEVGGEYVGDPLRIGFNAAYIAELLKKITTPQVQWSFRSPERASVLEPVDQKEGSRSLYLLMPLRLLD